MSATIERSYDGDGLLTEVVIAHPDETTDTYTLIWDTNQPIPEVIAITHNGASSQLVYGPNRAFAVEGGTATTFEYSVFGDITKIGGNLTRCSSHLTGRLRW